MTKTFLRYICIASLTLSANAFAQGVQVTPSNANYSGASSGIESSGTGTSSGPSVNDGANKTKNSNSTGQAMSVLTGALFFAMGASDIQAGMASCPACNGGLIAKGVFEIMLGGLSMKQGGAHSGTAGAAGFTGFNTDGLGTLNSGIGYDLNSDPYVKAAAANLKKAEQTGIIDMKTGTAKVGDKTYKMSDFTSKEAMLAAGIPPGAVDGLMSLSEAIEKKAAEKLEKLKIGSATATNGFDEGGGSGVGSAPSGSSDDGSSSSYAGAAGSGRGVGLTRDPSSLAGMQKNYNGEPIGVAADSIFLMMNRRYKVKESQESFFNDAELAIQK